MSVRTVSWVRLACLFDISFVSALLLCFYATCNFLEICDFFACSSGLLTVFFYFYLLGFNLPACLGFCLAYTAHFIKELFFPSVIGSYSHSFHELEKSSF